MGATEIAGPDAGGEAKLRVVGDRQRFGFIFKANHRSHRAEDFFLHDLHRIAVALEQRRLVKPAFAEIRRTLDNPRRGLYLVYRRGFFLGTELKHGGWNRDRNYLLFRRDAYRYTEEVHERLLPETPYGVLRERLIHYTHRSIDEFVRKSSRYATWGAEKYLRQGRRGRSAAIFGHAAFNFIRNYLFRLGFLDGTPGLIVAMLSSYYVAEKWAKLWELERNPKK